MEPLSAASGIVTLLGAATTITNDLRNLRQLFRDAQDDYLARLNEISDSNAVLHEAHNAWQSIRRGRDRGNGTPLSHLPNFADDVTQAKALLDELGAFLKSMTKQVKSSNEVKVDRIAWVKQMKVLKKRRKQLKAFRIKVDQMLGLSTAYVDTNPSHMGDCKRVIVVTNTSDL